MSVESRVKKKLAALPNVRKIHKHWHGMMEAQVERYGKDGVEWKKSPFQVIACPPEIDLFRQLHKKLRSRMFRKMSAAWEFNPKDLITYQPCINASAVLEFAQDKDLVDSLYDTKKAYVLGTAQGPVIWNGNHRATADLFMHRKFKALYLDLSGGTCVVDRKKRK